MEQQGLSETINIQKTHHIINEVMRQKLYQPAYLPIPLFWKTIELLTADYKRYRDLSGMLTILNELDRVSAKHKAVPRFIHSTFTSK
jgi:hypothetical protein